MITLKRIPRPNALSLLELMAALAITAVLAGMIVIRAGDHNDQGKAAACHANQGEIELQCQLWWRNFRSFPAANLNDIGANAAYFPDGVPTCPVDGSTYTIDANGRVVGHTH